MCSVSAPKPKKIEVEKPVFVRNLYLDETDKDVASANAMRRGRSSLVIPENNGIGFEGRNGSGGNTGTGQSNNNSQNPLGGGSSGPYDPGTAPQPRDSMPGYKRTDIDRY